VISRWRPVVVLLAGLLAAACGAGTTTPSTRGGTAAPDVSAPAVSQPAASDTTADQTDTEWGRIWDTVPSGFPTYPGSTESEVGTEPASAVRVIDGAEPSAIASWMDQHLKAASFDSDGLSGPFEDGSYVADASGAAGCRVQVRVAPTGGTTTITVLYGGACPHG
jgi:hypothetical protein